MKKISALLLAVVMAFGMAGCSDSGSSDSDNESSAAAVLTHQKMQQQRQLPQQLLLR